MLLAGHGTVAETLVVNMATAPEVGAKSWAPPAGSAGLRVREGDRVYLRLPRASGQG